MEITIEQLEVKRREYLNSVDEAKATLNARYGALQAVEALIAQLKSTPDKPPKK